MSLDIIVYARQVNDDLIPKIVKRLNEFDMICEIHPEFSFNTQDGFLPFKFKLTNPQFEILKDKWLLSGFEIYIDEFDFQKELINVQPKVSFWNKLINNKAAQKPLVSDIIDARLKDCNKSITFVWHGVESFDQRFVTLTSAILTELVNGVCTYPADDIWYENDGFVESTWAEIKDYENTSLNEKNLKFIEFEKWD